MRRVLRYRNRSARMRRLSEAPGRSYGTPQRQKPRFFFAGTNAGAVSKKSLAIFSI
jgi:hypothetical protein